MLVDLGNDAKKDCCYMEAGHMTILYCSVGAIFFFTTILIIASVITLFSSVCEFYENQINTVMDEPNENHN